MCKCVLHVHIRCLSSKFQLKELIYSLSPSGDFFSFYSICSFFNHGKNVGSENEHMRKRNTRDIGKQKYWNYDKYPRGFGPRSAYTVSLVSDTCRSLDHMRQISFIHQLCSRSILSLFFRFIRGHSNYLFHVVFTLCLVKLYICHWRMRSSRTSYFAFVISRLSTHFEDILCSICMKYTWYEIHEIDACIFVNWGN